MLSFKQKQLLAMSKHALSCKYEGAGGWTYSNRLEYELQTKKIRVVPTIKCCGCGYSLDYPIK